MQITTRPFHNEDLAECLKIEAAAVPANWYFKDVLDYFTTTKGELTLGLVDGQIAGFGKLTVLFDGSAWLELLRVDPRFQRKGVGAHIYQRYLAQLEEMNCPAVAMYTGVRNVASAALAEKNGLPWQMKHYLSGGTDAQSVQRTKAGVRVTGISAAVRYLHAPNSVCSQCDAEQMLALARLFIRDVAED